MKELPYQIKERAMKAPPNHSGKGCRVWRNMVDSLMVGEFVDLQIENLHDAQKAICRAGKMLGFKVTTRKSDHGTLEVYRIA